MALDQVLEFLYEVLMPSNDPEKNRAAVKKHYYANKAYYFAKNLKARARKIAYVRELKNNPCLDCGLRYPFYVMEFDHRDSSLKFQEVGRIIGNSWRRIKEEIAKCDLVCANCHRARTYLRRTGGMADTLVLETSVERHAGSSPASGTNSPV